MTDFRTGHTKNSEEGKHNQCGFSEYWALETIYDGHERIKDV